MPASTGCYRAMRPTNLSCGDASRTRRWLQREISGKLCQIGQGFNCTSHVDTMNYALRFEDVQLVPWRCADFSVLGEVFGCRKTTLGVMSRLSGATRVPRFPCFLTEDWIEKHAELQVALALAVGEQQLEPWMQTNSQGKFRNPPSLAEIISFWSVLHQFLPLFPFEPLKQGQ